MKKRILSMLLAIVMVVGMLPVPTIAAAELPDTLYVGGVAVVTDGTVGSVTSGTGWSYDTATATLYLTDGADIRYTDESDTYLKCGIYCEGVLNVHASGKVTVTGYGCGMYLPGGSLYLHAEEGATVNISSIGDKTGIYTTGSGNEVALSGKGTVNVSGINYGIFATTVKIDGVTLNAQASTYADIDGSNIYVGQTEAAVVNCLGSTSGGIGGGGAVNIGIYNGSTVHVAEKARNSGWLTGLTATNIAIADSHVIIDGLTGTYHILAIHGNTTVTGSSHILIRGITATDSGGAYGVTTEDTRTLTVSGDYYFRQDLSKELIKNQTIKLLYVSQFELCTASHAGYCSNGDGTHYFGCFSACPAAIKGENETCSGETTCTEKAFCEICKTEHGPEPVGHIPDETTSYTDNGDGTHSFTCSVCGVASEAHDFTDGGTCVCSATCPHSGGTATCTTQAVCDTCGKEYGELAAHTPDANGKCTVDGCGYQYAAKVGDTFYETIHKALRAAEGINGCTLTLLDDVTLTSMSSYASYVNTGTFTLDLNGKTLSSNKRTLEVMGSADLTIRDSIGGGKIVSTGGSAVYLSGGKLTIESGTFEGTLDGVFLSYDSTLIVKGGTFTGSRAMITGSGSDCVIDLMNIDPSGLTLKNNGSGTFAPKLPDGYGMVDSDGKLLSSLSAEQSATVHKHEYKYTDLGDGNHQQACSCGLTTGEPAAHSTTAEDDKAATCVAPAYCSVCDSEYGDVDKTNHDETVTYENGFCPNCDTYQSAALNAEGFYEIFNAGQLYWFAAKVNSGHTAINGKLMKDIVVNEGTMSAETTDARAWTPIGNGSNMYTGTFNGAGFTVSGLYFNDETAEDVGLFGFVGNGATIQNVTLAASYLSGKNNVGGIVGLNYKGTVSGCTNSSEIVGGERNTGGVVGSNYDGTVSNCTNSGDIASSSYYVGGVVGYNSSGSVTGCTNSGDVSGSYDVGGIVGWSYKGTVSGCANSGKVSGKNDVGGVLGANSGSGTVSNCFNTGTVNATSNYAGGVVGMNSGSVSNCYNIGSVSGHACVGGVAGTNTSVVTNCYYLNGNATDGSSTVQFGIGSGSIGSTTADIADQTAGKFSAQFASGEVAYLLNGDQSIIVFKQTIGSDDYPNFTGATVYAIQNCKSETLYSNTNENIGHQWENGVCTVCDEACSHTGGEASCAAQAVCDICGVSYGELGGHTPADNAIYTDNGNGTHSYTCSVCSTDVTEAHSFGTGNSCVCGAEVAFTGIEITSSFATIDKGSGSYIAVIEPGKEGTDISYKYVGNNMECLTAANTLLKTRRANSVFGEYTPLLKDMIAMGFTGTVLNWKDGTWWEWDYSNDGGITWEGVHIDVKQGYTITNSTADDAGGTIALPEYSVAGETVSVTVSPAAGYVLNALTVTDDAGGSVTVNNNSFTMPASNVTVSASFVACGHENAEYTDNGDGTHTMNCAACGATVTEPHDFENDDHKCACGKAETFTVYWALAEFLGLENGTSTFGQEFVHTFTVPENTHLRIEDIYLRSDPSTHISYTYENGVLTIAAADIPAGDIEVLCNHYVEVKFDANGGVIKPQDSYPEEGDTGFAEDGSYWIQEVNVSGDVFLRNYVDVTRTGYTLVDWRDANGMIYPMSKANGAIFVSATEDVTVYAQWQCNHTIGGVEFRDNGDGTHNGHCGECGELLGNYLEQPHVYDETSHKCACGAIETFKLYVEEQTLAVAYGADLAQAVSGITSAKTGYNFTGWAYYWLNENGAEIPYTDSTMPAMELYAKPVFEAILYNITWDMAGCSYSVNNFDELPTKLAYNVDSDDHNINFVEITAPEGYEFVRFEDGDGNALRYTYSDHYRLYLTVSGDMTVRAVIQPRSYMATWTDGDGASYEKEFKYGETITIPTSVYFLETFRKTGYTLTGWEGYTEGMTMPIDGVTFTAIYQVNEYTITFDSDGGSAVAPITQDFGTVVTAPEAPTRDGYHFLGWDALPETMPAKDITVKALWEEHKDYTYSASGDTITASCGVCGQVLGTATVYAEDGIYDGSAKETAAVSYSEGWVGGELTVSYENNVNAGTATASITIGGVTASVDFTIEKASPRYELPTGLTATYGDTLADVALPEGFTWQDDAATSVGNAGTNTFKVSYTPADTANYEAVTDIEVTVAVAKADPIVTAPIPAEGLVFNGEMQLLVVSNGSTSGGTLVCYAEGRDDWAMGYSAGTYVIEYYVMGDDNYNDVPPASITVTIAPLDLASIEYDIKLSPDSFVYDASAKTPAVEVIVVLPGNDIPFETALSEEDFTVSYSGNIGPGTATVTIEGKGNYTGSITKTFEIVCDHSLNTNEVYTDNGDGTHSLVCSVCDEAAQTDDHSFGTQASDRMAAPADCDDAALYYVRCDHCDAVSETETVSVGSALGHDYEAVVTAPTCTEGGYTTYTCSVCGDTYVADEVAALGHDYEAVVTAPTCTEGGYTTYTCSVCGDTYVADEVAALGHTEETVPGYAATCTEPGLSDGSKCSVCGETLVEQEEIPALGHDYEAVVTAPTCTEGGYTTYTCTVCGDSYVADEVAALGHTEETVPGYAATCTEPGLSDGSKCSVCGETLVEQEEIPALGHDYEAVVTEPTCTEGGYTTYTCSVCGDSYVADEVPAHGHVYDSICDLICNICGYEREIPSVPLFRMYDPNSGEHFYTGSERERDILISAGWNYEGVAFNFPVIGDPVYRLYNPVSGDHLYTMDEDERAQLLANGWNDEGVAFNSATSDCVPQYRLWNPNAVRGAWHFTGSEEERDHLLSLGWQYQGIGWYSMIK